jgi:parvulin-like peptidyl-prolyl isomerase
MSQEVIETEDGLKIRKLTELRPSAAEEYRKAIEKRVDYFSQQRDSIFNNMIENMLVKGLETFLEAKVKVDDLLGDQKETVQNFIEKLLFIGL